MNKELKQLVLDLGLHIDDEIIKSYKDSYRDLLVYTILIQDITITYFTPRGYYQIKYVRDMKTYTDVVGSLDGVKSRLINMINNER